MSDNDYEIVSVEPTDPPTDVGGTGWHCYVIGLAYGSQSTRDTLSSLLKAGRSEPLGSNDRRTDTGTGWRAPGTGTTRAPYNCAAMTARLGASARYSARVVKRPPHVR